MSIADTLYSHPVIVTFRIDRETTNDAEYLKRLTALEKAIEVVGGAGAWKAPTSCFVFRTSRRVGEIGGAIARALDLRKDVALVSRLDGTEAVYLGVADQEAALLKAMPYAKKLG